MPLFCPHAPPLKQVVFLPNYNVSEAEVIIPAAELRCGRSWSVRLVAPCLSATVGLMQAPDTAQLP